MKATLSTVEARRVALAAQGFGMPPIDGSAGTRALAATIRRLRTLQIDSVNVFARSHYMPLFSRLGAYETDALDRLLFTGKPSFVEYWAHVAAFIPAADWGLFDFRMQEMRRRHDAPAGWTRRHADTVAWVRDELASRGPLRPAQIERDARRSSRGPWWDWDEVKSALEYLWLYGEVAIAGRRGFERRYGLASQVIPDAARVPVPREEAIRELVSRAAAAYGVATASDLADYWRIRDRRAVLTAVHDLVDAGELSPVAVEGWRVGGRPAPAWVHRSARLPRRIDAAAILTPFDPVVWFRERAARLFDFEYRIEIYTPAARRRYGYYSLPIVVGDDVVGRTDLKADRARGRLLVQSAWWEPGAPPDAAERVAERLRAAAAWQGLDTVSVSHWGDATDDLAGALGDAARHDAGPSSPHGTAAPVDGPPSPEGFAVAS